MRIPTTRRVYSMSEDRLLQYKRRIKEWEKRFHAEHGRVPSKADCKADEQIWKAYKTYNQMKLRAQKPDKENTSAKSDKGATVHIDVALTEDEEEHVELVKNAELGPTPQANGKVLSIFDMVLSPPESSPLKQRGAGLFVSPSKPALGEFKTPTKAVKKLGFADLTPSRAGKPSIMLRLEQASSPRAVTPKSVQKEAVVETPFYLGKVNNKFLFREDGPGDVPSLPSTPTRSPSAVNFQVSPSPLKSQRFLSFGPAKKVSDLFLDYQSMTMDEDFEAQRLELEKELEEQKAEDAKVKVEQPEPSRFMKKRKKTLTQKRTTRRWKIKPKQGEAGDAFEGKDVHAEIEKLQAQQRDNLEEYMGSGSESEESEEEEFVAPKRPASTKINPVSNNFQRLKINDPRAKKFKQRMKRR